METIKLENQLAIAVSCAAMAIGYLHAKEPESDMTRYLRLELERILNPAVFIPKCASKTTVAHDVSELF